MMCCSIESSVRKKQVIGASALQIREEFYSSFLRTCGSVRCPVQCVVGSAVDVRGLFSFALLMK